MRIWFLKNTKTYNITTLRSPYNTNWDENWISPWFWFWKTSWITNFIYKFWINQDSNTQSVINQSNNDIKEWATYNYDWNTVYLNVKNTTTNWNWNLDNYYPTAYPNRSDNWYSVIDSTNWINEKDWTTNHWKVTYYNYLFIYPNYVFSRSYTRENGGCEWSTEVNYNFETKHSFLRQYDNEWYKLWTTIWWYKNLTFKIQTEIPFSKFWNANDIKNIIPKYIIPNCLWTNKDWTLETLVNEREIQDSFNHFIFKDYLLWVINSLDHKWFLNSWLFWPTVDTTINWKKFDVYQKLQN